MSITLDVKNVLFLPSFSCQHPLSCRHLCIVVSALFLHSMLLYLLLLSQTSKEAQLFRCCVPLPSSVRGMITSCITRRPQSLILAARVSFFTCRRSLSAFVYTLESVNITKNCKKYWQHFLCYNTICFLFSDLFHSRIDSVLTILCCTPLPNMEGESDITGIRQ